MMEHQGTPPFDQRKSSGRNKYKQSNNVDDEIEINLSHLLHILDNESESKDFTPLIEFFEKDSITQVVRNWSYYAQINNHSKLIKLTILLTQTLVFLGSHSNVFKYGGMLIKLLLINHVKVLYRSLNNMRASITIPTIHLMKQMIDFNSGQYIDEFTLYFDFSLNSLIRILTVDKKDISSFNPMNRDHRLNIRFEFVRFWLSLISLSTPLLRKDVIMNNSRIMRSWFKQMDKADTPELMEQTIRILCTKIVQEKAFKRMTKTRILNEFALSKIYACYYSSDKSLVKTANEFFLEYGADKLNSVAFSNNFPWHEESPVNDTFKGVPMTINQREFKIHNKLLFNVLKNFKPWESDVQCSTVLKILDHVPELVPLYCHFLASQGGAHDPKMTSYWFGCTMLFGRIINSKIPDSVINVHTNVPPSSNLVIQVILPLPLTKVSLTKALHHERMIIAQLACQLLVFSFQKFSKILQLYEVKGWSSAVAPLRNLFYQSIPDLSIISSVRNQCYLIAKENKILQLSLTLLLKYYSAIFPNFFNVSIPSSSIYTDIMRKDKFSGMDLEIINNFLQFQEINGLQTRWWHATVDQNSLFTSLLKMASSKNSTYSVVSKIHQLLEHMFQGTVIFKPILCSPLWVLIYSLQVLSFEDHNKDQGFKKIWKLLDECICRCMKIPYRYVDLSKDYGLISPFLMALCEQWKFIDRENSYESVARWILILLRSFAICGESAKDIRTLAQNTLVGVPRESMDVYLTFENYEAKVEKLFSNSSFKLSNFQTVSFFQHITIAPYSKLEKLVRYPVNELDAVGLIWRLQTIVQDSVIIFNRTFEKVVSILLSKLGIFSASKNPINIINPIIRNSLFPKSEFSSNEKLKTYFVSRALFDLYHKSILNNPGFQQVIFHWLSDNINVGNSDVDLADFTETVCASLQVPYAVSLLEKYKRIPQRPLEILLQKALEGPNQRLSYEIIEYAMQKPSYNLDLLLSRFIDLNRIIGFKSDNFVAQSLETFPLAFQSFTHSKWFHCDHLLSRLPKIEETEGAIIAALCLNEGDNPQFRGFLRRVLHGCYEKLNRREISSDIVKLFCFHFAMLPEDKRVSVVKKITMEYQNKYSSDVIKFVKMVNWYDDPNIISWLNGTILHGTKYFSDSKNLSAEFSLFLSELGKLAESINIWSKANHSYLRGQLEVILAGTWVANPLILQYVIRLLTNGRSNDVQCTKMLQMVLNNERNALNVEINDPFLRFTTAGVIYILFMMDPQRNSTDPIQSKLLGIYCGTMSCEDRILFKVIKQIETVTSTSWTNELHSVDFLEERENEDIKAYGSKIITFEKEGIFMTIDKDTIINTVNNFPTCFPIFPEHSSWEAFSAFYNMNSKYISNSIGPIYDPEFLMLLSLQNAAGFITYQISKDTSIKCKFEIQKYLSSGILQVLILSLAVDGVLQKISLRIICGMLCSLEEYNQSKHGNIISILLRKIVFTFEKAKVESRPLKVASCIWFAISRLLDLLLNPAASLHEKAFRWVLNFPSILPNDLPLLQDLITPNEKVDYDNFYRQLSWVLECLDQVTMTSEDLVFIKSRGILEWLSNLKDIPYLNSRLRTMLDSIVYKIQRLENGGSTLLTRYASVSHLELHNSFMRWQLSANSISKNYNDKKLFKNWLVLETNCLNTSGLLIGQAEIMGSQKRLRLWSEDDQMNVCKRIKL